MYTKITNAIKEAMIAKNNDRKDVLKQIKSKADMIAKENKSEMSDEIVQNAISKEMKQLNQTLDAIKTKTESDLYKSTVYKIEVLKEFLPKQLTTEEIESVITNILSNTTETNKGKLTGMIMKELKGKADTKVIMSIINQKIQ